MPATIANAAIGTLIQNTELQSNASSRAPPASGPSTMPRPDTAAHAPMALPRSSAGKIAVMIDSVEGMMNAPPTPISARVAVSISLDVARAEAADPTANTTRPNCSARLRPKRSPRQPAVSSRPANTSRYESTIHCSALPDAPRSSRSDGIAVFRIVLSREMIRRLRARTPSAFHRLGYGWFEFMGPASRRRGPRTSG